MCVWIVHASEGQQDGQTFADSSDYILKVRRALVNLWMTVWLKFLLLCCFLLLLFLFPVLTKFNVVLSSKVSILSEHLLSQSQSSHYRMLDVTGVLF